MTSIKSIAGITAKTSIRIRKAEKKDLKKVAEIFKIEYAKPPYNEKWSLKNAAQKVNNYFKLGIIYIAGFDNNIVGFIIASTFLWDDGKRGFIDEIAVKSEFQGNGIGKQLITFIESYFKNRKIKHIALLANPYSKAFKIYRRMNYKKNNIIQMTKNLK